MEQIKRVAGTQNYAIKNDTVYKIIQDESAPKKTICECLFCGERFGGDANGKCAVYCKNCRTKEGRKKVTEENEEIKNQRNGN